MSQASAVTVRAAERPVGHLGLLFATLTVVMLLASLSQMIFSTALATIVGELHGVDQMMWVITGYMLASTITMPIYGKAGDLFGRKPLLIVATVIFLVGTIIGGAAPDMTWLIIARVVQGLGGGGLIILSQAAVADVVPARERGKYMGLMGGVFAISSVAGPLLGGWLTEGPGWRWVFWVTVPLALLALTALFTLMPSVHHAVAERPKIDTAGIVLMALATSVIVFIATWGGHQYAWLSPQILGLAAIGVALSVAFAFVEARAEHPVIPLLLFKNRNFVLTTAAGLFVAIAMFGALGYLPTYFQMAEGVSAAEAGLLMVPLMGSLLLASVVSGIIVSRTGRYRLLPITGALLVALGMWLLSTITPETSLAIICAHMAVLGIGLGLNMQILTLIVQNEFPHRMVGTATAANNYFRQVGASLGSAIVGSLFVARLTGLLAERLPADAMASSGGSTSLRPAVIAGLPEPIHSIVIGAYNEALVPIFVFIVPLGLLAAVLLYFVHETPLATQIEHEIPAESLAEGQLLITEYDDA
ncbi:MAG: MDR family MFS transporter [Actinomycetota bacterium]|nr:MDR family MFS transporter [Actinomycetota bacterium]